MLQLIQLKLSEIQYGGDAIGNDIRVEIQSLNLFLGLNKKIKHGTTITIDKEIGHFFVDQVKLPLSVNIKVIEQDLVFNDVGSKDIQINVDLNTSKPQYSTHDIQVSEHRSVSPGVLTAIFSITLEVSIIPVIRYVSLGDADGWLNVIIKDSQKEISLPAYLKVRLDSVESKREYFTILEGPWQGTSASVRLDSQGNSFLMENSTQTDHVQMTYSISKKVLTVGRQKYLATDDPTNKWKKGFYDIEIPDSPHRGGIYYSETKYGKTWFRVGHNGDRYLHTGRHSLGCITLTEQNTWDVLCQKLMKACKNDGKSIGTLEIID